MPVLISGVLKDGTGTPVQNCTIQLKACRTSTTVVVNTVASENPDEAGRYSMDVEQGQYTVTLLVEGYPPSHAGVITVYDDSKPGTLNDFLGAMTEDDVRPEALRRFEAMVEEVARQASEASRNATAAGQASEQAQTSAGQAAESATAAVNAAGAADASATQAASSAASAESSAGTATTKAGEASASAASADTARTAAAASAAAAKTSEANADASRTAAGDSAAAATASATAAQVSAERAGASETAAKTSETQAASSAGDAGASATAAAASEKAAAASAAEAKTSETNAATSANTAAASATAASSSASAASTHAAASDTSASLAAQSSTAAGAAATRAEDAAKRAEDIADVISLEDASLTKKGIVKLSSATDSDSEALAATPKAVKAVMSEAQTKAPLDSPAFTGTPTTPTPPDDAKGLQTANAEFVRKLIAALVGSVPESLDTLQELAAALGNDPNFATTMTNALAGKMDKAANGADIPNKPLFLQNVGLVDVLFKGDGRFLAGTFVSDAIDRTSIGARAATGCQFMRAHQAPDAPDQVSFWQIITLSEVVSPTTVVDVLAVSGNNVLFGHGTGAGITSWRQVAMLEGGAFTGGISAPNMRGDTLVTVGDGTGGMAKGDVDGAGFNGNNLNIKSWNGIGFQNSEDLAIRVYISTRLGVIAAAENLQAGSAIFNKNGDVYGDIWGGGSGPGWLSAFVASKPARQYITMVGVYQNDKTKPFMLHDDGSGVFLATTDMLSGYVQSIRFGAVEHGNLYRSPGFADQLGYVITGVENGDSNDTPDRIQRRLLQLKVNGQWYTVGA
ncbi:hypothetical protein FTP38_11480 [Salmonella enterica]|nr:hypothetical protein [Salmonella enterica]EFT3776653.1 hypothetical protein [Salmonella enterica]ELR7651767.1 prophage tail fiber N-terminal domain-containing protein [Salmonella enterica]